MISPSEAAAELLRRRNARRKLYNYILYRNPQYKQSGFALHVCEALDKFIEDMQAGKRPILVLQAPPQHGKSEIVSRNLPAFLMDTHPEWRIGAATYNDEWANSLAQDVRNNLNSYSHQRLFPRKGNKKKYVTNRVGEFSSPNGSGGYIGVGVGSGLTGRSLDIGIIDDPTKDEKEALSPTIKESRWNWYQTVFTTRLSENSGQIIMATSWAEDDLPGKICEQFKGDERLTVLRFPAINLPTESGYNPVLPLGALVPELKSLKFLQEIKKLFSDYWWSALYQQSPRSIGGNVFKESGIQYYLTKDLPAKFDKIINSWDCTFKDTDGTDYVVGLVLAKKGAYVYLLAEKRDRMSFTRTVKEVVALREAWPLTREILIEDKANGPAVIDTLKSKVSCLIPIEPDGSKLARAHAVTAYWEAMNIWLPHPDIAPWIVAFIAELTAFPAAANDDRVDAFTQGLRRLYPLFNRLGITQEALNKAMGL